MPTVTIIVSPPVGKEEYPGEVMHLHPDDFEFSRVPSVNEIVALRDKAGLLTTYRVVGVVHISGGQPVDAELYAKQVDLLDVLREIDMVNIGPSTPVGAPRAIPIGPASPTGSADEQ